MWPYDDGRSRAMDPDSRAPRPGNYYDDAFDRQPRYQQPLGAPIDAPRSHRKSVLADPDDPYPRHQRRSHRKDGVRLATSDDGDPFRPDQTSKHDMEHKNSDQNREFRKMRGGYDYDEGTAFKRPSKSYSPSRGPRDPSAPRPRSPPPKKSAWGDDDIDGDRRGQRSSKKAARGHGYADDDLGRGYGAPMPPRASRDPGGRHHGGYESDSYRRYPDPQSAAYGADEPPRHSRHARDRGGAEDGYNRGRRPASGYYDDPLDNTPPRPKDRGHRDRQSLPPQSRYDNKYSDPRDDPYQDRPRRRASIGPGDRYSGDPRRRGGHDAPDHDDGHAQSKKRVVKDKKSKKAAKEAGSLFMTYGLPVIKKEAVPFLMKSAQAYMSQRGGK